MVPMAELLARDNGYCRPRRLDAHRRRRHRQPGRQRHRGRRPRSPPGGAQQQDARHRPGAPVFHGDGAVGEGAFHEALTLASMWNLPVVFICENNKYGMSMSSEKAFKVEHIATRPPATAFRARPSTATTSRRSTRWSSGPSNAPTPASGPPSSEAHLPLAGPLQVRQEPVPHPRGDREWRADDPIAAYAAVLLGTRSPRSSSTVQDEVRTEIREAVRFGTRAKNRRSRRCWPASTPLPGGRPRPGGPRMRTMTYAEAVREAMATAMTNDDRVFLMGEGRRRLRWCFRRQQRPLRALRHRPRARHHDQRTRHRRHGRGRRTHRHAADRRDPLRLSLPGHGPGGQPGRQAALHGGRPGRGAAGDPRPGGSGTGAAAQHSQSLEAWFAHVPG